MIGHLRVVLLLPLQDLRTRRPKPDAVLLLTVLVETVGAHPQPWQQRPGQVLESRRAPGVLPTVLQQQRVEIPPQGPRPVGLPRLEVPVLAPVEDLVRVTHLLWRLVRRPGDVGVGHRPAVLGRHEQRGMTEPASQHPARPRDRRQRLQGGVEILLPRASVLRLPVDLGLRARHGQHQRAEQVGPPGKVGDGLAQRGRVTAARPLTGNPAGRALPGRPVVQLRDQMPGGLGGRYRHGRGVGEMPEQHRPVDARGAAHHELVHPGRVRRPLRVHALRAQPRILEERPLGMEQVEPARQVLPAEVRVHRPRIEPAGLQDTLPQIEPVVDVLRNVRIVEPVTTIGSDPRRDRRQNPHQARRCRRHRNLQVLDLVRAFEQLAQAHARRLPGQ